MRVPRPEALVRREPCAETAQRHAKSGVCGTRGCAANDRVRAAAASGGPRRGRRRYQSRRLTPTGSLTRPDGPPAPSAPRSLEPHPRASPRRRSRPCLPYAPILHGGGRRAREHGWQCRADRAPRGRLVRRVGEASSSATGRLSQLRRSASGFARACSRTGSDYILYRPRTIARFTGVSRACRARGSRRVSWRRVADRERCEFQSSMSCLLRTLNSAKLRAHGHGACSSSARRHS